MTFKNHVIKVNRSAFYSTYGSLSKQTRFVWIVFHGYGQLAKKFIKKFDFLDTTAHFIIAPEGLSRFYWHGNNEPVSSWMTKENRYDEINDFVAYIDDLYRLYTDHIHQNVQFVLLGFSQGCATMWRWIHARRPNFDVMINWAGWIPEDIGYLHLKEYLVDKRLFLTYSDTDHFITPEVLTGIRGVIEKNQLDIDMSQYDGGHKLDRNALKNMFYTVFPPDEGGV